VTTASSATGAKHKEQPADEADSEGTGKSGRSKKRKRTKDAAERSIAISLEHGRWRHFVLIWKIGTVGKGVGIVLLIIAAINLRSFVQTLLHAAGDIKVSESEVELPVGLCRGQPSKFTFADIKHAFFLRRAVPWTRAGPVLIVEAQDQIFTYPRDWFASDSDQQRVAMAINKRLGRVE
jgi:hypothetical protein